MEECRFKYNLIFFKKLREQKTHYFYLFYKILQTKHKT